MRKEAMGFMALVALVTAGIAAASALSGTSKPGAPDVLCGQACLGGGGGTTTAAPPPTTTSPAPPATTTTAPPSTTTTSAPPTTTTTPAGPDYNAQTLGNFTLTLVSDSDQPGTSSIVFGWNVKSCAGGRLKTRVYSAHWSGSITGGLGWTIKYVACYIPNSKVLWGTPTPAYAPTSSWPVNWDDLNDPGFPSVSLASDGSSVSFRWQGKANSCVLPQIYCTHRHPGDEITFYPNNTEMISGWGG